MCVHMCVSVSVHARVQIYMAGLVCLLAVQGWGEGETSEAWRIQTLRRHSLSGTHRALAGPQEWVPP